MEKKDKRPKANTLDRIERYKFIADEHCKGRTMQQIIQAVMQKFGIKYGAARMAWDGYCKEMQAQFDEMRPYYASLIWENNKDLYQKAYDAGKYYECKYLLDQQMKLVGLDRAPVESKGEMMAPPPITLLPPEMPKPVNDDTVTDQI